MQNKFDALSSFVTTNVYTAKRKLDLGYKAKDHMRKEEVYPFPSYWIFFFPGYFWPVPDAGNWPVQLKYLQMTLSYIHPSLGGFPL